MNQKDIRWRQRFQNYTKALQKLDEALQLKEMSELERAGLIQYFEFTFELGWKTLKDYLEAEGQTTSSPREAIKQAFQNNIINDGETWLEALSDRNIMTHTYNEEFSKLAEERIRAHYFKFLQQLYTKLDDKK